MTDYISRLFAALALVSLLIFAGCKGSEPAAGSDATKPVSQPVASDSQSNTAVPQSGSVELSSSRSSDERTGTRVRATSSSKARTHEASKPAPELQPTSVSATRPIDQPTNNPPAPATPSVNPWTPPVVPAPQPPAEPPKPVVRKVVIPSGTMIPVRMIDSIDSGTDHTGDTFRASLDEPVKANGETVLHKGSDVYVKLADVQSAGNLKGKSELRVQLDRIVAGKKTYTVESNTYVSSGSSQGKKTARTVGIGSAIGAAIGAIAGGGKGAAIGAGVGAGGGVAVEAATKGEQVRIASEAQLVFRLEQPLEVTLESDPR